MVSALNGDGVDAILDYFAAQVPEGPWLYPEDQPSDLPLRILAAEITREKLFERLHQELPYISTVETEQWQERKDGSVRIEQTIYVERDSQKSIVLGKKRPDHQGHLQDLSRGTCRDHRRPRASVSVREGAGELGGRPRTLPGNGPGVPALGNTVSA
jgi:hypothetical protein